MIGRRISDRVLISCHVVVPVLALLDVTGRKLPVFFRLLDPFEKPFFLLLLRDVEKELANDNAITGKISLEVPDVLEALLPNVLRHQLRRQLLPLEKLSMHAHDERLLVVATVEDADATAFRQAPDATPHEIVIEILLRWSLEGKYLTPLRVDSGHHVLDRAVLPRGVHRLKDQQHRPAVLRVKHVLKVREDGNAHGKGFLGTRLVLGRKFQCVGGVDILQAKTVISYPERFGKLARLFCEIFNLFAVHEVSPQCDIGIFQPSVLLSRTAPDPPDSDLFISRTQLTSKEPCAMACSCFHLASPKLWIHACRKSIKAWS